MESEQLLAAFVHESRPLRALSSRRAAQWFFRSALLVLGTFSSPVSRYVFEYMRYELVFPGSVLSEGHRS